MIDRIRTDRRYGMLVASAWLAIGSMVAIGGLSFLSAVCIAPPVPDPDTVCRVYESEGRGRQEPHAVSSYADYLALTRYGPFAHIGEINQRYATARLTVRTC